MKDRFSSVYKGWKGFVCHIGVLYIFQNTDYIK